LRMVADKFRTNGSGFLHLIFVVDFLSLLRSYWRRSAAEADACI